MVQELSRADREAGVASSIFFLFIGLAIDKTVSGDAPPTALFLLWLFGILSGGVTWYLTNKSRNLEQQMKSNTGALAIRLDNLDPP